MQEKELEYVAFRNPDAGVLQEIETLVESVETELGIATGISFDHMLNHNKELECYFLAYEGKLLVGAATVFAPTANRGEIAVCVQHGHRRRGIGSMLLSTVVSVLDQNHVRQRILICDAKADSGNSFAHRFAVKELFREYTMSLTNGLPSNVGGPLEVRSACEEDIPRMAEICAAAYGDVLSESRAFIETSMIAVHREGYVGSVGKIVVAVCFISSTESSRSVNTVAVDPQYQGRGYGKEFLTKVLHGLPGDGVKVVLDVNSTNSRAFRLYERLGFNIESHIRYYEIQG